MNRRQSNKVLEIVYPSRVEGWLDAYGMYLFLVFIILLSLLFFTLCTDRYINTLIQINQLNLLLFFGSPTSHMNNITGKISNKCCHRCQCFDIKI